MTELPLTRISASAEKAAAIRAAVRAVAFPPGAPARLARIEDAGAFFSLVADPGVSGPIYTLPKPISLDACRDFIARHVDEQARGEGLLIFTLDNEGAIGGYHDIEVWPQWSAADLGGAIRPDLQGSGRGREGAQRAFDWLFETLGVDLLCETAALDNVRSRRIMEGAGFRHMGEIDSPLLGGGVRRSHYWELARADWLARRSGA